jgi:glycosyltransferase involved in cell wall biosynthesis
VTQLSGNRQDVVLLVGSRGGQVRGRTDLLAASLTRSEIQVVKKSGAGALIAGLGGRRQFSAVITAGPPLLPHLAGAVLRRAQIPWIADQHELPGVTRGRAARFVAALTGRLLRQADLVTVPDADIAAAVLTQMSANSVPVDGVGELLVRLIETAGSWRREPQGLRVLVVGPTNSTHLEEFALQLRRHGVDVFAAGLPWGGGLIPSILPANGVWVSAATWPAVLWLRRLKRQLRPDVVHAHWLPNAVTAKRARAHPLVASAWGSDVFLASPRGRAGYRRALPQADAVLADSAALLAETVALGARPERSHVIQWGVDLDTFCPSSGSQEETRRSLGIEPGPVLLSMRGLKPIYNPDVVIGAFARLAERFPDLQLVLKHNDADLPTLTGIPFAERVHVVGPRPRGVLADWLRAASVCVSLASTDSSPRSVWEAMACGCPCVVSDLPWARQEIEPGRHALLVPIDVDSVAQAIERILTDRGLARALVTAALAHVQAHHDRDVETRRIIELYRSLAGIPSR